MRPLLAVLFGLILAVPAFAQVRYKDAEGVTHFVDSINDVPPQFRAGATGQPSPSPSRAVAPSVDWDKRAKEAEEALERERRLREAAERPPQTPVAQQPMQPVFDNGAFQTTVDWCIRKVREAFEQRDRMNRLVAESNFSAFVNGPGGVTMVGTTRERYAFQACMASEGAPIR